MGPLKQFDISQKFEKDISDSIFRCQPRIRYELSQFCM